MPEIMPTSERLRLVEKISYPSSSTSASASASASGSSAALPPSPYLGSTPSIHSNHSSHSQDLTSTAVTGALSPPPPTHYLRSINKGNTRESEEAIRLLQKRSQLYEARKSSSHSRSPSSRLRQVESDEGLLLGREFHSQWNLDSRDGSNRGRTITAIASLASLDLKEAKPGYPLSGKKLLFLDVDPASPSLLPASAPSYQLDHEIFLGKDPNSRERRPHSHSHSHPTSWNSLDSLQGSFSAESRPTGTIGASGVNGLSGGITGSYSNGNLRRPRPYHRSRRTKSTDSSFSSSSSDSTNFGTSLEPCSISSSPFDPPTLPIHPPNGSNLLNQIHPSNPPSSYLLGQPIMLTPEIHAHDCKPHNCTCNLLRPRTAPSTSARSFGSGLGSGPGPGSPNLPGYSGVTGNIEATGNGNGFNLSDVQKRRRAIAFNLFTSYNEAVPFQFQKSLNSTFHQSSNSTSKLGRSDEDSERENGRRSEREVNTDVEDAPNSNLGRPPSHRAIHSVHSVPDFHSNDTWSKHSQLVVNPTSRISSLSPTSYTYTPPPIPTTRSNSDPHSHTLKDIVKAKPRRKSSIGFIHGLKSLLNPKHHSHPVSCPPVHPSQQPAEPA